MNRRWRKRLSPIILLIGIALFVFGVNHGLMGVMIISAICIISSLISIIF